MRKGVIKVRQTRSPIRRPGNQRACLIGLGLNRIGRVARLENTSAIRGMIRKVRHLVCVLIELKELSSRRFNALGGYARSPGAVQFIEEMEWHATGDERLLGMLVHDRIDNDFGWIILGRDERLRFRAIDVNSSLSLTDEQKGEANLFIDLPGL
jgi:ribosomal protein L30